MPAGAKIPVIYVMARYPQNTLILECVPFVGFMPVDVRQWLKEHLASKDLAGAMAGVANKVGELCHEADETDDPWIDYAVEEWWELYLELFDEIRAAMGETYDPAIRGSHYAIQTFMEQNGFRDGSG